MPPSPRSLHCSKLVPLELLCKSQAVSLSQFYSRDMKVMGFALQLSSYRGCCGAELSHRTLL